MNLQDHPDCVTEFMKIKARAELAESKSLDLLRSEQKWITVGEEWQTRAELAEAKIEELSRGSQHWVPASMLRNVQLELRCLQASWDEAVRQMRICPSSHSMNLMDAAYTEEKNVLRRM